MLTTKILLNSYLHKGVNVYDHHIKDFYLNTPMVRPEYILKLSDIPTTSLNSTNLTNLSLLMDTLCPDPKGMYGLPQAASSLNNSLKKVGPQRLPQSSITPGFWKHDWPLSPSLYVLTSVSNMLASNMHSTFYKLSTNTTKRHKTGRHGTIPSNKYNSPCQDTAKATATTPVPIKPQHQPYPHTPRLLCAKQQFVDTADDSALLPTPTKPSPRKSSAFSCTRAVDCTMLPALGSLATQQSAPTQNTMSKIHQFLYYP
eukprot:CCRYP_001522-RA/>CCRYP_001522-RA protein AED:0.33 eAED:0.15 QI:0/0/0/1/0/0.5/2/0/256